MYNLVSLYNSSNQQVASIGEQGDPKYTYYMTDKYTNFTTVIFAKHKSDVSKVIEHYYMVCLPRLIAKYQKSLATRLHTMSREEKLYNQIRSGLVQILHTDYGTEFKGEKVTEVYKRLRISHDISAPEAQSENRVVEIAIKQINGIIRKLILTHGY